jgi:UDP-N-acetyl-D-mannosaminuronate dehydrogenase
MAHAEFNLRRRRVKIVSKAEKVVIVGLGEVGKPLFQLLSRHYDVVGVDISPPSVPVGPVDLLHICYPFEINDFVGECVRYIELFRPTLTIINSTVSVGTTRAVADRTGAIVVHSPVRGKHVRMFEELQVYTKFVGAPDSASAQRVAKHFELAGLKTRVLSSPEATELAKLTETTYFGLMIAWAQEVERLCDLAGTDYEEVSSFYEEINFFPKVKYFPGVIGGHCVMPNIKILERLRQSSLLQAIQSSNRMKIDREKKSGSDKVLSQQTDEKVVA